MNLVRPLALLLIVLGLLAFFCHDVAFVTEFAREGRRPLSIEFHFNLSRWVSGGVILAGIALFGSARRR